MLMKKKIYMAAVATILCTALIAPVFTMPVHASEDGKEIIFEDEEPFVTALWGKYSKFDGKLVYRLTDVKDVDFYVESVEEVKAYGFEVVGEYVNERGETYYKFKYVGVKEVAPETPEVEEPVVTETPAEETVIIETPAEETVIIETPVEETVAIETLVEEAVVIETPVEETVVIETPVEETVAIETLVEEAVVIETPVEETVVIETPVEETVAIETLVEEAVVIETPVEETVVIETPVEETVEKKLGCRSGHCEDAKEIVWEI